jgi:hypothetical protein
MRTALHALIIASTLIVPTVVRAETPTRGQFDDWLAKCLEELYPPVVLEPNNPYVPPTIPTHPPTVPVPGPIAGSGLLALAALVLFRKRLLTP